MAKPLDLFWWSPRRDAKLRMKELRANYSTWFRMKLAGGEALTNFGDELSPLVLQYATGRKVRWAAADRAEVIAVGSILEYVDRRTQSDPWLWGTGLRADLRAKAVPRIAVNPERVLAVRGPRTQKELGLSSELPIGDPGVLAPELGNFQGLKRSGTLFIPHFRTWSTPAGRKHLQTARSLGYGVANPSLHPVEMISLIARADFVLSSSLHGVVVAHSLGIPAQLVGIPTGGRTEPEFKYRDYYESVKVPFSSIELSSALQPGQRDTLLALHESTSSLAQANCRELAGQLTTAIHKLR